VPVVYSIDVANRVLRTRCVGNVKLQDVIHHFRALDRDAKCPDRLDVFLDLSEADSIPDADQISTLADQLRNRRSRIHFGACAIVADRDALFGMMRMFEALAERSFRLTCTFRSAAEAESWLQAQRSLGAPPSSRLLA
jgi:hypothetical protein